MKKLKIILLCSLIVIIYVFFVVKKGVYKTFYDVNTDEIKGIVTSIELFEDKLRFIVSGKEKIVVNDYLKKGKNIVIGDFVSISGKIKKPNHRTVFHLFDYRNYLLSKKIYWTFTLENIEIVKVSSGFFYKIKNEIRNRINSIDNGYLSTFILGDNVLDKDVNDGYRINGISHLFAISGMHITFLSGGLLFLLQKLLRRKNLSYLLVSVFLLFYMFLTDFSPSVIRSSSLFIGSFLLSFFNKKYSTLDVLVLITWCFLIYNPYVIYDVGFLFSFIISFFLCIFGSLIRRQKHYIGKVWMTSLIAFLASFPIVINQYFEVNFLSPILNLIFVPFVTFVLFPFSLLVFLFPFLNFIYEPILFVFERLSSFFSGFSLTYSFSYLHWYGVIFYYVLILFLLYFFIRKKYIVIVLFFCVLFIHYNIRLFQKNPELVFIDVGQGDCSLILLPHNQGNIMIDTGGSNYDIAMKTLIPYLKSLGVHEIDALILTHGDFDHMGASIPFVYNFPIREVIFNSYKKNNLEKELSSILEDKNVPFVSFSKNVLRYSDYEFVFLNGKHKDENADSLIVYTKLNNQNILFMGDAGKEEEAELIYAYQQLEVDILKVGHHGSKTSTSEDFLNVFRPSFSIVSVGRNNLYGHPHSEVIDRLKKYQASIFLTSVEGSIRFVFDKKLRIYFSPPTGGTLMQ